MQIPIVGFDPSLNNWGYAIGTYDVSTSAVDISSVGVISPETKKDKRVRKSSHDLERAEALSSNTFDLLKAHEPYALFVEVPVGSQSARAMASYGMCIGVLGAIRSQISVSVFEVTPNDVKIATTNNKKASKQEIIDWAVSLYPSIDWPRVNKTQKIVIGKAEHSADAIGAIYAGLQTTDFQQYHHFLTKQYTKG